MANTRCECKFFTKAAKLGYMKGTKTSRYVVAQSTTYTAFCTVTVKRVNAFALLLWLDLHLVQFLTLICKWKSWVCLIQSSMYGNICMGICFWPLLIIPHAPKVFLEQTEQVYISFICMHYYWLYCIIFFHQLEIDKSRKKNTMLHGLC